jgi:hypothetical protein
MAFQFPLIPIHLFLPVQAAAVVQLPEPMKKGDRVKIHGESSGIVAGTILAITNAAALPMLANTEIVSELAKQILADDGVQRVALIQHPYFEHDSDRPILLTFAALEDARGWRDLQGQRITFETIQTKPHRHR